MIQIRINTQRSSKRGTGTAKQRDKLERRQATAATHLTSDESDSNHQPSSPADVEKPVKRSSTHKRRAPEDITNTAKRCRAPRASQPSVAQAFEEFGPKYCTRRRGIVTEAASEAGGKENLSQPIQSSLQKP